LTLAGRRGPPVSGGPPSGLGRGAEHRSGGGGIGGGRCGAPVVGAPRRTIQSQHSGARASSPRGLSPATAGAPVQSRKSRAAQEVRAARRAFTPQGRLLSPKAAASNSAVHSDVPTASAQRARPADRPGARPSRVLRRRSGGHPFPGRRLGAGGFSAGTTAAIRSHPAAGRGGLRRRSRRGPVPGAGRLPVLPANGGGPSSARQDDGPASGEGRRPEPPTTRRRRCLSLSFSRCLSRSVTIWL